MEHGEQRHLDQELAQMETARERHGLDRARGIVTSQDAAAVRLRDELRVGTPFQGFDRWLLPFEMGKGNCSIIEAAPDSATPTHSHSDAAMHIVMSGKVTIEGRELGPGEWAYIPAGVGYSLHAGESGARVLYPHWT